MLLRNFDFASNYYDVLRKIELKDFSSPKINGWYKFVNGKLTALLVSDNNLFLLYENNQYLVNERSEVILDKNVKSEIQFNYLDNCSLQLSFSYSNDDSILNFSPFEYIDEDDFKWEKFIEKIINDKERQKKFVANLTEVE